MNFVKLKPKSSLHLGIREGWTEGTETFIHSDTLFSAFCHSYLLLYGEKELKNLLDRFIKDSPPFLISSTFPFWDNEFYFPVPKNQIPEEKELKKVQFVVKEDFEKLLQGERLNQEMKTIPPLNTEEKSMPWKIQNVPHVSLSRFSNHPGEEFFHSGEVWFRKDAGLFFLINFVGKNFESKFKATMNLLVDEGIGGDRSSGKGFFEKPEFGETEIKFPEEVDGFLTLSLYFPQKGEISNLSQGFYELIERKGYIFSPSCQSLRRKSVRMFAEGSLFPKDKIKGELIDVTPDISEEVNLSHKVYRYGFPFSIPWKLEVKNED